MMIADRPDTYVSPDRPAGASSYAPRRSSVIIVGWGINNSDPFANEIQRSPDLTMPQTPADPLDDLGEAATSLAIRLRGVGPALGRLRDVLNPHREMKPIEHVVSWTRARGFAE